MFVQASGDRNYVCAENARAQYIGIKTYITDYDETYPQAGVWNGSANFATEIGLYSVSSTVLRCPATRGGRYRNNTAVAGVSEAAFLPETTPLLQDDTAHPDGGRTMLFADGYITQGGKQVYFPNVEGECFIRLMQTGQALQSYAQDYDEMYPHQSDDSKFRDEMFLYLQSNRYWTCPATATDYIIAQEFRGRSIAFYTEEELQTTEFMRDARIHRSRNFTRSFLDGHVVQTGPRGAYTPPPSPPRQPADVSLQRLKIVALAFLDYAYDHNNIMPPTNDLATVRAALLPYLPENDPIYFEAVGSAPLVLVNPQFGGMPLTASPTQTSRFGYRV